MISVPCHPAPLSAMSLLRVAGTPREVFALPGASSSNTRPAPFAASATGKRAAIQGRYAPRSLRDRVVPNGRPNSVNPGTNSLNALALIATGNVAARAWREPGGGLNTLSRLARILKRALDFHGEAQLSTSFFQESQPFTELASGSRICRHGRSFVCASLRRGST